MAPIDTHTDGNGRHLELGLHCSTTSVLNFNEKDHGITAEEAEKLRYINKMTWVITIL